MAGKGPRRMKRTAYHGATSSPPRWHRPAYYYLQQEVYLKLEALCGYEISSVLRAVDWSTAVKPKGELCKICERKAEETAP